MRQTILILLLASILFGGAAASSPKITRLKIPVLAPAGADLTLEGSQAFVGDSAAKVVALATPADDLILMLVLDLSGEPTAAQRAKVALLSEIDELPSQVYVAVLRAQDGLRVLQDPTADRTAIKAGLESVTVSGRAGLLDSVEAGVSIADSILAKSAVRVAILYVTDSDVTNYREDFENPVINSSDVGDLSRKFPDALIQEKISKIDGNLTRTQAPVFVVHVNYRNDRLNEAYRNGLRRLTLTTGGMAAICHSSAEIPAAIRDLFTTIKNLYSVTVELPVVEMRSVDVKLSFDGRDGSRHSVAHRSLFVLRN